MKKLFLCSSFADVAPLLPTFVKEELNGKTITFIPTASIHEEYKQYVEDGREALQQLGCIVEELEVSLSTKEKVVNTLEKNDYIYVSGGNTFFLLHELRKKGADEIIQQQIKQGKLYIGESAGAMITSPNIEYVKEMDDLLDLSAELQGFEAMSIVDFYPVPHFGNFPFEEATKTILQHYKDLPLMPISNEQVIEVIGETVSIKGTKE